MKLGVVFPQTEIGTDPLAIKDFVQAAEGLGYDYLLTYEHVLGADPADYPDGRRFTYTFRDQFHEPLVLFGYLAALTQRLEFATGILILPQRNTALVAKQATEVDLLSGGRLRLGIGVGWNEAEMRGVGYDFATRGRRMDEQIALLRALWTEPLVTFKGAYHTVRNLGINPLPIQRPIPLWFGGAADPVLRRMARFGAGWMPSGLSPEQGAPLVALLREYLAAEGRDPAQFGMDVRVTLARQPRSTWDAYLAGWRALGATHVCVNTMKAGLETVADHVAAIADFKAALS